MWILMQVFTRAWACTCIPPQKVLHLSAVCVTQLSGVTSNTPTHTLSLAASVFLSWDVCSPSTSICLGFLSLSLWCRMTDRAKCQFIFCCWFDITAVSLHADLCQRFIQDIQTHKERKHKGQKIRVCEGEKGRRSIGLYTGVLREILGLKTCSNACPTLMCPISNGNPLPLQTSPGKLLYFIYPTSCTLACLCTFWCIVWMWFFWATICISSLHLCFLQRSSFELPTLRGNATMTGGGQTYSPRDTFV